MSQLAIQHYPSWNELWALAYADGANNHSLSGHRLENYAACYADIAPGLPLLPDTMAAFWDAWQAGRFDAEVTGPWHFAS